MNATIIRPASPLPAIVEAVNINGYTQPGAAFNFTLDTDDEETDVAILQGDDQGPTHLQRQAGSQVDEGLVGDGI